MRSVSATRSPRAGFIRSTGHTVWWGSDDPRIETFAAGSLGWQLEVGRLSSVMLERAVEAGVQIERRLAVAADHPFVIDCTGRAGVIARQKNLREYDDGLRTVALVGEWRREGDWPVPDDTHTLIESYDDGWMWSVPAAGGVRHIAAMVDPQRSGAGARRLVERRLSRGDRQDPRIQPPDLRRVSPATARADGMPPSIAPANTPVTAGCSRVMPDRSSIRCRPPASRKRWRRDGSRRSSPTPACRIHRCDRTRSTSLPLASARSNSTCRARAAAS